MYGCNQTVTIWNRLRNPATHKDEWHRCVIPVLVRWKSRTERSVSGTTASVANTLIVLLPPCPEYLPAKEWAALTDKSGRFTLQKGDLLALGAVDMDITGVAPQRESDIKNLLAPDVMTIKSIADNTRAAQGKHYRVEGF